MYPIRAPQWLLAVTCSYDMVHEVVDVQSINVDCDPVAQLEEQLTFNQ